MNHSTSIAARATRPPTTTLNAQVGRHDAHGGATEMSHGVSLHVKVSGVWIERRVDDVHC
jgi:hypothetical protein